MPAAGIGVLLTLVGASLPAAARIVLPQSVDTATVVLVGGWELPDLTVRWSDADAGLWVVRADGARRLYRPEELVGLRDADGRDITAEVLPEWALQRLAIEPPPTGREIGDREGEAEMAADAMAAGDWRLVCGFEAGMSKPHELDLLDSDGGIGLDVRARLQLAGPVYLAGGYSWQDLKRVSNQLVRPQDPGNVPDVVDGQSTTDARIEGVWAGLSFIARGEDDEAARFYLEGGLGRYTEDGLDVLQPADAYLGYHGGLGFLIPLSKAVALDLGVRGTHLVNLDLGYGDDLHTLFGFRLGLVLLGH